MSDFDFDFIVIGGGSGGYAAARTAAAEGLNTAVVDGAKELGGLCILRGCMPSKTLIESANRNLVLREAEEFGLNARADAPDISRIRDRKRTLIGDFAGYRREQLQDGRFQLHRGRAAFTSPHEIRVTPLDGSDSFTLTARSFCLATGSVSAMPPIPGLAESNPWTSDDILDTDSLPESFIVLGGGAIALEMAHYLDGVNRKVTLVQRSAQVLTGMDPAVSEVIRRAYAQRGIDTYCGTRIHRVENTDQGRRIHFEDADGEHSIEAAQILVALGRRPASEGLGLHEAHIGVTGHKVQVVASMQTTQPHIFAAGDICSPLDVVHLAIQQGEIAARNAAKVLRGDDADLEEIDYRLNLFGVFCRPQVAGVGATEEELKRQGIPFLSADYPFDDHGKSMVMGETAGFVKMLAHRDTGEILGAVCVGPEATELIHEIVVAMHYRSTVEQFLTIPHYHPTLSEIWTYPAEELADERADA